ncbi:heavy metal-associated isoprenylated plant protein 19-like [Canna indica]|uniref:Heavy metal-associated isoprenylated plant protein 19-like n=1 Tax=Canna indica TaxID=4628 RepID=A0AAQ3L427_9LILI|nr:heavy metal-associated isoprenylated plant protein 19-like [Canna indica]
MATTSVVTVAEEDSQAGQCPSTGVNYVKVDMSIHNVIVTGDIEPDKVVKKLKKKTGKRADIIKQDSVEDNKNEEAETTDECSNHQDGTSVVLPPDDFDQELVQYLSIFSDDNPNGCSIV